MIILRQREFGKVKRENKQANRIYIINQGINNSNAAKKLEKIKNSEEPGFFEFKERAKRQEKIAKLENLLENTSKDQMDDILRKYRASNKESQVISTPKDRLASLDPVKKKELKKRLNARRLAKEIEDREISEDIRKGYEEHMKQKAAEEAEKVRQITEQQAIKSKVSDFVKNNKKALIVGGTGAALIGGGAYLIHRHNKKKKEEKELNNE